MPGGGGIDLTTIIVSLITGIFAVSVAVVSRGKKESAVKARHQKHKEEGYTPPDEDTIPMGQKVTPLDPIQALMVEKDRRIEERDERIEELEEQLQATKNDRNRAYDLLRAYGIDPYTGTRYRQNDTGSAPAPSTQ